MIYKSLTWGLEVVITDSDAFILRDPFPFMARWPDAGFLTTSDHLGNTTGGQGLENHNGIHTAFNIGYMFFRGAGDRNPDPNPNPNPNPNPDPDPDPHPDRNSQGSALPLVEEWRRVILEQPEERWDQVGRLHG